LVQSAGRCGWEKGIIMKQICIFGFLFVMFTDNNKTNLKVNCPYEFDSLAKMNVFTYVDKMPEYKGGQAALLRFIAKNFQYPNHGQFQASFQVQFVVNTNGAVIAPRIKNKKRNEITVVESELLKLVLKMPKWNPGACFDKTVPVMVILPVQF
jgi:periplasmic protein TonB